MRPTILAIATSIAALTTAPSAALADTAPGASQPAAAPVETSAPWKDSLEFGASSDSLTNNRPLSSQTYISAIESGGAGRPTYYEQWIEQNQYGLHDSSAMAGTVFSAARHTLVGAQLALSPSHNVLPSFDGELNIEERFGAGFGAALAFERRTYPTVNASITTVTLDRYFGSFRIAYHPTFAQLAGTPGTAMTNVFSATRYDNRGGDATATWFAGRDVESTGPLNVLVLNVSGISLSGHQVVARNLAVAYGLETYTEGSLYTASGGHLGLRYAF
jgi:YaiO family outer membrane protein